jgi:SAM-dependent methyltransferase
MELTTTADAHQGMRRTLLPSGGYALGHAPDEQRRLDKQGALFRPATERFLREAGVGPGLRVLDVGCGTGSVTTLAAELVGSHGSVVGIDRSPEVLATARANAAKLALPQVSFVEADLATFATDNLFDAVVGRFVLAHQLNPVATVRHLAGLVRPGGVMAFADSLSLPHVLASPRLVLLDQLLTWFLATLRGAGVPTDFGLRLREVFVEADYQRRRFGSSHSLGLPTIRSWQISWSTRCAR